MNFDLTLSRGDVEAIVAALPLVVELGADTPQQAAINASACSSAGQKLLSGSRSLNGNEVRVVAVALNAAVLMLSGKCSDLFAGVDSELRSSLSKHFFVLNKLDLVFQDFLARSGF